MSFENDKHLMLVDPWFSSKVFNDSWSLLQETDINRINFDKLTHIFYTHEHPDHLNWPTLKLISERAVNKVWVIGLKRKNTNIKEQLEKMGFGYAELRPNIETKITSTFSICQFPTGIDSAQVFRVDNKIILNQNDCKLDRNQVFNLRGQFPKIDLWLMQFGLAGYYANRDDEAGLLLAQEKHRDLIRYYHDEFKPASYIPFASFVYFCKEYNCFLNDWQITMPMVEKNFANYPLQIVFYDDEILFDDYQNRNRENIEKWENIFKNNIKQITKSKECSELDILKEADLFANEYSADHNAPTLLYLQFFDNDNFFHCDFKNKIFKFVDEGEIDSNKLAGILPMEELHSFFKFPWGADTLNITSCFDKINDNIWRNMLIWKDNLYHR